MGWGESALQREQEADMQGFLRFLLRISSICMFIVLIVLVVVYLYGR